MKKHIFLLSAAFTLFLMMFASCEKENSSTAPNGEINNNDTIPTPTLVSLVGTEWEYLKIDTLYGDGDSFATLEDLMTFSFNAETSGTFKMEAQLREGETVTPFSAETYPVTYTFVESTKTGEIHSDNGFYNFNYQLVSDSLMDVRIETSNPMHFLRKR